MTKIKTEAAPTPIIFLPITNGQQLASFSVDESKVQAVQFSSYIKSGVADDDEIISITERAAPHIMIGRIKAAMERSIDGSVVITDIIPKFAENSVAVKRETMLRNISLMAKMLMDKLVSQSELFWDVADLNSDEFGAVENLIHALEDACPIIERIKLDPDKVDLSTIKKRKRK